MILEPRAISEGYAFQEESGDWAIKPEAPEWAKKEMEEFIEMISALPNKEGIVTQY